jgi:hypothetical protein
VHVRLALLIALTSSALALLPILGLRLASLLANYAWSHGSRLSRARVGRAQVPWCSPAVSANPGVSRAPPAQTRPKRSSPLPVVRARVFRVGTSVRSLSRLAGLARAWPLGLPQAFVRVMLPVASIRSALRETREVIAVVGLCTVLAVTIGILAALYGS